MEHEVRAALYNLKCLGRPASGSECSAESAAIDAEEAALQVEYKQTRAVFDGTWISIPVTVSPRPKNRNEASPALPSVSGENAQAEAESRNYFSQRRKFKAISILIHCGLASVLVRV